MPLNVDKARYVPVIQNERLHRERMNKWINAQIAKETSVNVTDFGAIGDGASHPLSSKYQTLDEAKSDYPQATSLTDEMDWCAWRAAIQFIYDNFITQSPAAVANWAAGKIVANGAYVFNRTLVVDLFSVVIEGSVTPGTPETALGGGSSITYNGPDGTVDAPIAILDCYVQTESGGTPTGRLAQTRGIKPTIQHMGFFGKNGSMSGAPSASGFIQGIRIRKSLLSLIDDCAFGGTLYDGIVSTAPALFPVITRNRFYGVHRDAIAFLSIAGDFSTTQWIRDNEFGFVGRYAILCDTNGSVEAMPIVRNNSFEHAFASSYYVTNPAWFVHGAVTAVCFINSNSLIFDGNRLEAITTQTAGYFADIHLVKCNAPMLSNMVGTYLLLSANKSSSALTAAATSFMSANSYLDITNTRNYRCGTSADFSGENSQLRILNWEHAGNAYLADGKGLDTTGFATIENSSIQFLTIPVSADTIVASGATTRLEMPEVVAINASVYKGQSVLNNSTSATTLQLETVKFSSDVFSAKISSQDQVDELEFFREFWLRLANPETSWNGYKSWTLNRLAGNVMAAESNFIDTPLFYARPRDASGSAVNAGLYEVGVITKRKFRFDYAAAPASGTWNRGDIVYYNAPSAGGYVGAVCVTSGTPGTWKDFGAIAP